MMGAFDPDMLALTMEGPLGFASLLRGAGLVLLCAAVSRRLIGQIIAGIGMLLALASFGFVGHATTTNGPWLGLLVTGHLLGLAFWLGALWPLYQEAGAQNSLASAARIAERFGKIAFVIVPALILFGGIFAYQIVGDLQTLFTSSYGQTLLVKLALVASVLGFAALNKWRIVPQMQIGKAEAGRHLQRSIMLESLVILAVLAVTAVLTTVTSLPMTQGH
jgi:putative copper resistance protein D